MTNKLPTVFLAQVAAITQQQNFGIAQAAKRGRNSKFPYVPIINYGEQVLGRHRTRTQQVPNRAYATAEAAIKCAQGVIDLRRNLFSEHLCSLPYRALREQHGLPRDLPTEGK